MHDNVHRTDNLSVNGLQWVVKESDKNSFKKLEQIKDISNILKAIISKRKLYSLRIEQFLNPKLRELTPNPLGLHDMDKATDILQESILKNHKIGILGDYDVDGATSSALIFNYLNEIGLSNLEVFIPDREKDGYGLSKNAVSFFFKKKISMIVCLDCGTNDKENVNYALSLGIETIIIDHHEQKKKNNALALINPKKNCDNSKLNYLATVGLVFLFLIALNSKLKKSNFFSSKIKEPNLKKYLDLVALGTVCDLVPLKEANRLFVKKGIIEINKKSNKGIKTLLEKLNIKKTVDESDIGFYLGPCINAPGRIGESSLGFRLLTNKYEKYSSDIANSLLNNNKERKTLENIACHQAKNKISTLKKINNKQNRKFVLVSDRSWHPGIIGIIASRLTYQYNIPSIVISSKEASIKGSIRSIKGINAADIIDFLDKNNILINGGGHAMAAGFTLKSNCIEKLEDLLTSFFSNIIISKQINLEIDIAVDLYSVSTELIEKISAIGPFGQENEEPRIVIRNLKVAYKKVVGKTKKHIFCVLEDTYGKSINAIAFNEASSSLGNVLFSEKVFNVAGKLRLYEKKNQSIPQFIIEDILIL